MADSDLKAYPEHFDVDFSSLENLMTLKKRHNELFLEALGFYQKFANDDDKVYAGRLFIELYKQTVELAQKIKKHTEEIDFDEGLRLITNMMRRDGDEYIEQEKEAEAKKAKEDLDEQIQIDCQVLNDK
jgi:methionyl-tRNA synthetase